MIANFVPVNNALFASTAKLSVYGEARLMTEGSHTPFTRYNRLSNQFDNRFHNRFDNRLYRVNGASVRGRQRREGQN